MRNLIGIKQMRKKYLILFIYFIYVTLLFMVSAHNDFVEEEMISRSFNSFDSLDLLFRFIAIAFIVSSIFLIIAFIIHKRVSFSFIILAPFLNLLLAVIIGILVGFVLWITDLEYSISDFQRTFIIATFSTTITTLWLLGDLFHNKVAN